MGYGQASELSLRGKMGLLAHLKGNHYPPLPDSILKPALRAIYYANRGQWDKNVRLPDGVYYRGKSLAPVRACVEAWHLDCWIKYDE